LTPSKLAGYLMLLLSPVGIILYNLWFLGLLPGLDPDLAVRITAYLTAMAFLAVVGALGYLVVTAPRSDRRGGRSG